MNEILDSIYKTISSPKFYIPIIAVAVFLIVLTISRNIVKKLINKNASSLEQKRRNTIVSLLENIIKYLFGFVTIVIILSVWGVNVSGLVAGIGVAGVVGGLALQDALKDIIMGCNIILDNYFVVGDLVSYDGFTGEVIEFGLKNTKIKNFENVVLVVANREINKIKNLSQKSSAVSITIATAYEEKEENIEKVLKNVCKEIDTWDKITKPTEYLGIDNLNASSVDYLLRAHCPAGQQFAIKRKILSLVKREFDKNNIKIPYSQIEVHNGK